MMRCFMTVSAEDPKVLLAILGVAMPCLAFPQGDKVMHLQVGDPTDGLPLGLPARLAAVACPLKSHASSIRPEEGLDLALPIADGVIIAAVLPSALG